MKFADQAKIYIAAGDGGNGCISFRREKYVPKGGPDGGDGGDGGSIILIGNKKLQTLYDLKIHPHYRAGRGGHGKGKKMVGKNGKNLFIPVPLGIIVQNGNNTIGEILVHDQQLIAARGGKGGRGNIHFITKMDNAPRHAEQGSPGEKKTLEVILKLISQIGLVGLPNSGKSTLLNSLTSAKSKVGSYPFTTLTPNLGVLQGDFKNIVIADMPGIIEGAHSGKGLGLQFLRHIERANILVLIINITVEQPLNQYRCLLKEFKNHGMGLIKKPRIVVFNKIDLLDKIPVFDLPEKIFYVSALKKQGIEPLVEFLIHEN